MPVSPLTPMPTSPRPDLYGAIHKALRLCLLDTLCQLGRADPASPAEQHAALTRLDRTLALLRGHQRLENDVLHTAIEARRPGGSQRGAEEHAEQRSQMDLLDADVQALRHAPDPARWQRLYRHVASLVADHLRHMQTEEGPLMATLCAAYSDTELGALRDRLLSAAEPQPLHEAMPWIGAALSPDELADCLAELHTRWPAEAFERGLAQALGAAGPEHRARVLARLGPGVG